jgi:hypothetical protein
MKDDGIFVLGYHGEDFLRMKGGRLSVPWEIFAIGGV